MGQVGTILVRHEGQPQPQFREAHGGRCEVDAKQRAGEDIALHGERRTLAGGAPQSNELVERAQEEGARPCGGIEHREPAQVGRRAGRNAVVHPARRGRPRKSNPMREYRFESCPDHFTHQRCRGVVAPARPPVVRVHHAFEHAAQHVRRYELAGIVLAHGEVKALEQVVERVAPIGVAPHRRAMLPLES